MSDHSDELEFLLAADERDDSDTSNKGLTNRKPFPDDEERAEDLSKTGQVVQYARYGSGYKPTSSTVEKLPAGCYDIEADSNGHYVVPALPPSGLLLELPQMRSDRVISLIEKFWASEKDYKEGNEFVVGGATYKAGILIYGPPGSGKSCTIKILSKKLVERGGTVFYASTHPSTVLSMLADFSRIEPNRKSIVILEDIDALIERFGESTYLEMLDSAKTIDNAMFIATTNYPERLDPRIFNRPGRFSSVVKIDIPTSEGREAFLKAVLKKHDDVDYIVKNTNGFTVDHLSALINAVYREKKDMESEISRLRLLYRVPKSKEGKDIGFANG